LKKSRLLIWSRQYSSYDHKGYYGRLGLEPPVTADEVRAAFIKLSKENHPDMDLGNPKLHKRFQEINEAYAALKTTRRRIEYDAYSRNAEKITKNDFYHDSYNSYNDFVINKQGQQWTPQPEKKVNLVFSRTILGKEISIDMSSWGVLFVSLWLVLSACFYCIAMHI